MDPEKQKRQYQLLFPTILGVALLGILKAFDRYLPFWLAITLYVLITLGCIVNAVRVIRLNRVRPD